MVDWNARLAIEWTSLSAVSSSGENTAVSSISSVLNTCWFTSVASASAMRRSRLSLRLSSIPGRSSSDAMELQPRRPLLSLVQRFSVLSVDVLEGPLAGHVALKEYRSDESCIPRIVSTFISSRTSAVFLLA